LLLSWLHSLLGLKELGLSTKTIVATGALDQACGAIGVGNREAFYGVLFYYCYIP